MAGSPIGRTGDGTSQRAEAEAKVSLLAMQVMQLAPASEEVLNPSDMAASFETSISDAAAEIDWQLVKLLSAAHVSGAENAEDVAVGTAAAFAQAERVRQ